MEEPLVSVLMASYNHEKYVEAAVRSIMEQKGVSFELLVIDDGSVDSSPEILQRLQQEYGFSYVHRPNKGLVPTMNELFAMARGKYFCSFASDDIMPPDRLKKQSDYLECHAENPLCFGQIVLMDAEGHHGDDFDPRYTRSIPRVSFDEFFLGKKEVHGCSEMIKLDFFRANGGYDSEFPFEDFPQWLRFFKVCGTIPVLSINCCYYRQHGKNMSLDNTLMYGTFLKVLERYKDHPLYNKAVCIWKSHWFSMLAYCDKREALKRLPELWSFSIPFLKRLPKLFIPRFLLKH